MTGRIEVELEFLRRALGAGREGHPADVDLTSGALPPDLPVSLPDWAGVRVLGGIRSVAPRWTFFASPADRSTVPEHLMWRVFLDVPLPQDQVMRELTRALMAQGWRTAQMSRQAITEAEKGVWMAVHPAQARTLHLVGRQADGVTEVWLSVQGTDRRQFQHLQGLNVTTAEDTCSLPALTVPAGAQVRWQGDGEVRQESAFVRGTALGPLLDHLAPQLELQEGPLLYRHASERHAEVLVRGPAGLILLSLSLTGPEIYVLLTLVVEPTG